MERKILEKIDNIFDGFNQAVEIIKNINPNAYLNCILLDLSENKNISIKKITYLYYEESSKNKGFNSYVVEIDNTKLKASVKASVKASFFSKWFFPKKQINELSTFDPKSFPPGKLDIKRVKIDIEQLIKIALNEPPHFIFSELENIFSLDASLFLQEDELVWRFLCENRNIGFRTLHINAESGDIVFNKLDKINCL